MSAAASLLGNIFELTRGDLESARFPFIAVDQQLKGLTTVRVSRLSEFWKGNHRDSPHGLLQGTENLVRGYFGQRCRWTFALVGSANQIQCWQGAASEQFDSESLQSILRANFPDVRFQTQGLDQSRFERLGFGAVVTGTPSPGFRREGEGQRDPLGDLCRAMLGHRWVYVVSANPVPAIDTIRQINELADAIKDVHVNHLLRTSAIDAENRVARRYVELLESKLKRFESGRLFGMWETRCAIYAETASMVHRGRSVLESGFSGELSVPDPIRGCLLDHAARTAPRTEALTSQEAAILVQMPREECPGFELVESVRFGVEASSVIPGHSVEVGEIVDRGAGTGNKLRLSANEFTKHGLVAGITGSGKTNSCQWLLDQVWSGGRGVPFLVIESAKSEYRNLLLNPKFRGLRVFTVGDETVSPLRLNPFEVPAGALVQTHIDYLKSLFAAAFVLFPPMPYVLEQALQEIYEDRGWDVARNTNARGGDSPRSAPNLDDLAAKIPIVVDRMGYDQRISMDVKAGLLARINQLRLAGGKGLMLNTRRPFDHSVFFKTPCVLELKQLVSDDEKAFVIGLLLIRLYEYHEGRPGRSSELAHVTLIEEAHRLLRSVSTDQGSEVSANPRGRAVEVFTNMLSEVRAFGEGVLVAEQIPSKLAPDVIKNTGFKLIHRLVSPDDRALMGRAVNLDDAQVRRLASLSTGEAVGWAEHTAKAVLVQVPPSQVSSAGTVSDDVLRSEARAAGGLDLRRFEDCQNCSDSNGGGCGESVRGSWDRPLLEAFRRVFNAMRLSGAAVVPAFAEFRHLVHRESRAFQSSSAICTLVAMAESDIERRGEFRRWSFADVDRLMTAFCGLSRRVLDAMNSGAAATLPAVDVKAFQERCAELNQVDALPFPGCRLCDSPCAYRYEMAHADPAHATDFRRAFLSAGARDRLPALARAAAIRSFFVADHDACSGAAFCFSVQQLASPSLNLATYHQLQVATVLKSQLALRK